MYNVLIRIKIMCLKELNVMKFYTLTCIFNTWTAFNREKTTRSEKTPDYYLYYH